MSEHFGKHVIDKCAAFAKEMAEYSDSIRIVVTYEKGGGVTTCYTVGSGSIYAQLGAVREWLIQQDEASRIEVRKEHNEGSD